jgi:hypothetical protein
LLDARVARAASVASRHGAFALGRTLVLLGAQVLDARQLLFAVTANGSLGALFDALRDELTTRCAHAS